MPNDFVWPEPGSTQSKRFGNCTAVIAAANSVGCFKRFGNGSVDIEENALRIQR